MLICVQKDISYALEMSLLGLVFTSYWWSEIDVNIVKCERLYVLFKTVLRLKSGIVLNQNFCHLPMFVYVFCGEFEKTCNYSQLVFKATKNSCSIKFVYTFGLSNLASILPNEKSKSYFSQSTVENANSKETSWKVARYTEYFSLQDGSLVWTILYCFMQ